MSKNGIAWLPTKETRQAAKLQLAETKRQAAGTAGYRENRYLDLDLLPTKYVGDGIVNNPNAGGLQQGRPWKTTPNILSGLWRTTYAGYFDDDWTWFDSQTPIESIAVADFALYDGDIYSTQWLGYFKAPHTANYTFYLESDDRSQFWLGDKAITGYDDGNWDVYAASGAGESSSDPIALVADQYYPIRLQFGNAGGPAGLIFSWSDNYTPPSSGNDFGFTGDQNMWIINGGFNAGSTFSDPAPTNPAYTYPDNSYTGKTYNFDGTSYMIGANLSIGGSWQSNTITIDFWFYPTANGIQLLTELGQPQLNAYYHTTLLEISSTGNIKARFWQIGGGLAQVITSTNTVDLNAWNHIYFTEDSIGGHSFKLNNVATTGLPSYTRATPLINSNNSIHYAVGGSDTTNMGNNGGFQGKIGYLNIHDYVVASTWTNTNARFRP